MNWFWLLIISVFVVSFANILQKSLMKNDKSDPISYSIFFAFLLGVCNLVVALIYGFHIPALNISFIFLPMSALLWGVGTIFYFKSLQILESSEVVILSSGRSLITITASLLFLGEVFNVQKLLGTAIILISIFMVANIKKGFKFNRGLYYLLGMVLCFGMAVIFDVVNLRNFEPLSYLAIANFLIVIILLIIFPKSLKNWKGFAKPDFLKKMLPLGILSTSQAILYYFALAKGPASQIAPISQAQVIVTLLLAVILLKERDHLVKKALAAVLVTIGVILLR